MEPAVILAEADCHRDVAGRVGRADVLPDGRCWQRPTDLPAGDAVGASVCRRAGILDCSKLRADTFIWIEEDLEAVELVGLLEIAGERIGVPPLRANQDEFYVERGNRGD